jgi:hypothetical protein
LGAFNLRVWAGEPKYCMQYIYFITNINGNRTTTKTDKSPLDKSHPNKKPPPPNNEIIIQYYYICFELMVILKDILEN